MYVLETDLCVLAYLLLGMPTHTFACVSAISSPLSFL